MGLPFFSWAGLTAPLAAANSLSQVEEATRPLEESLDNFWQAREGL